MFSTFAAIQIEVLWYNSAWWINLNGDWVGYYPICKRGNCATYGNLFTAAGLASSAPINQWYGEVFDSSAPNATSTDMGSGLYANQSWAGIMDNMTYFDTLTHSYNFDLSVPLNVTDSNCYSGTAPSSASYLGWNNYFSYGGPGSDNPSCH
jgi:hypothetical protein